MHVGMFVKPHPQRPSPPFLGFGDGNVSYLQIRSDRLATANLHLCSSVTFKE